MKYYVRAFRPFWYSDFNNPSTSSMFDELGAAKGDNFEIKKSQSVNLSVSRIGHISLS
jgi:hypothetical protein